VWTVRKAAGNALTELAKVIDAELALPVMLPLLQRSLSSPAWLEREAAVLALGALAAGYTDALDEHLPRLLPFLLEQCAPPQPSHVRVTAMWALGRYAEWVCRAPDPDLLRQCVVALTAAATDRHKRVQQSACSNLSSLAEWAEDRMDPFVPELCDVLMRAYAQYQYNNRKVMLDTLATLFGAAPRGMCQPHVFGKVVPALWADFGSLNDSDVLGLHYMETFGAIVKEAGASFGEFCGPLYQRALTYVEGTVTLLAAAPEMGLSPEEVDREFLYGALELLSALAEGLGELLASLADFDHLLALLAEVLKDEDEVTRETAYAVCGDLAIACPAQFAPIMPHAVAVMKNLFLHQDYSVNVANNAIWAVGEIALRMPPAPLQQQAPDVVNRLVIMLLDDNAEKKLRHNAAITLGRVALSCPHVVAQHLDQVGAAWCSTMRSIQNFGEASEAEKGDCLNGLAKAVAINPAAMASGLNYLCMAALSLKKAGPEVQQLLARMLQQVKHALQQNGSWARAYASVSQSAQNELKARQLLVP
jgi:transportin-1